MFSLKKVTTPFIASKTTVTVEQIHQEFDTASEKILEEANAILNKASSEETEELKQLAMQGFGSVKRIKEVMKGEKQKENAKYNSALILKYQKEYPNHKFITKEYLMKICKKYNLIYGKSHDYIGDIPAKNRKEILNFDAPPVVYTRNSRYDFVVAEKQLNEFSEPSRQKLEQTKYFDNGIAYYIHKEFYVVAPANMFNIDNKEVEGYQLKNLPKDPVVLYEVKEGFLIVSKWGEEENLEELKH